MKNLWLVRAGRGGVSAGRFLDGGFVEVGFGAKKLGTSAKGLTREAIVEQLRKHMPGAKEGQILNAAGQLFRFHEEVAVGDDVITYDPERRTYLFGVIESPAQHVGESADGEATYRRKVKWTHRTDRDVLSVDTKNTLGSTLTLFKPNEDAATEIRERRVALDAAPPVSSAPEKVHEEENDLVRLGADMELRSREFVEDRIARLGPYEMQDLVAGVLRAMGYKTRVSPPGPDGGHDIFASPDGLGLQEPRIFVEVKHRVGTQIGSPEVRSFLGARRPGDRCLYVSTGGFTKDARSEAQRAAVPLTLVDLAQLRELVVDFYERLDPEAKQLVPLKRLYWPIEPTE